MASKGKESGQKICRETAVRVAIDSGAWAWWYKKNKKLAKPRKDWESWEDAWR